MKQEVTQRLALALAVKGSDSALRAIEFPVDSSATLLAELPLSLRRGSIPFLGSEGSRTIRVS